MTSNQKLDIVFKKLISGRAFTKEGTQFFEEPFSSFRQIPLPYVYVNSDYIPQTAPKDDITVNGIKTITYVKEELMIPNSSNGLVFKTRENRLIPKSYGVGYGIELRTNSGELISSDDFPYVVDWENGMVYFEKNTPYNVDRRFPPLATYYYYSGMNLGAIQTYSKVGPRGVRGVTGPTGPVDTSTMKYRGQTDFSNPSTYYYVNDVVTYTTDGNSYICIDDTNQSPIAEPASWELISPSGSDSPMPSNVLWVNDPSLTSVSDTLYHSSIYYQNLQDAIDSVEPGVWTTIIVNHVSNDYPVGKSFTIDGGKNIHIIFRKWANVFTDTPNVTDFLVTIKDSDVVIENARFGGDRVYSTYEMMNRVKVEAVQRSCSVKFIDCRFNTKDVLVVTNNGDDCVAEFKNCHINSFNVVTNSIVRMDSCLAFCGLAYDAQNTSDIGNTHELSIRNTFFSNRMGDGRLGQSTKDVVILARRDDLLSYNINIFNSVLPVLGVILKPDTNSYSPEIFTIYSDNSTFYSTRLDRNSYINTGVLRIVGGNNLTFDDVSQDYGLLYVTLDSLETPILSNFSRNSTTWDSSVGMVPMDSSQYEKIAGQWNMLSL